MVTRQYGSAYIRSPYIREKLVPAQRQLSDSVRLLDVLSRRLGEALWTLQELTGQQSSQSDVQASETRDFARDGSDSNGANR